MRYYGGYEFKDYVLKVKGLDFKGSFIVGGKEEFIVDILKDIRDAMVKVPGYEDTKIVDVTPGEVVVN